MQQPNNQAELLAALRSLAMRAPQSKEELRVLEQDSIALALHIRHSAQLGADLPHDVWHFLSDADIRFKDPEYGKAQLQQLSELLTEEAA